MKRILEASVPQITKRKKNNCTCTECLRVAQIAAECRELPSRSTYMLLMQFTTCQGTSRSFRQALRPFLKNNQLDDDSMGEESTDDGSMTLTLVRKEPLSPLFTELEDTTWLPPVSDVMAWRDPKYWFRVRRRFSQVADSPPHPCAAYVRTDFDTYDENGKRRHDYYVYGILRLESDGWYTPSGLKKILWDAFDADFVSTRASGGSNPKYAGKTAETIKEGWNANRDRGSDKHDTYEFILQRHDTEIPEKMIAAPPGFYRMLAELSEDYDVVWTETALAHLESKAQGESDLTLRDKKTGKLTQADFKNCDDDDFFNEEARKFDVGRHPTTVHLKDTRGNTFNFQVSYYREIQMRACPELRDQFSDDIVLINMNPKDPDNYRIYKVKAMDMTHFWTYMPFTLNDPRHQDFLGKTLIPRQLPVLEQPEGPTKRIKVRLGTPRDANTIWCGRLWMSGQDKAANAERKKTINACIKKGLAYEKHLLPSDLPESPWRHPWYFFKKMPIGFYGYYEWWVLNQEGLVKQIPNLYGKTLTCWCDDNETLCHANVLAKYANLWGSGVWKLPEELDDSQF